MNTQFIQEDATSSFLDQFLSGAPIETTETPNILDQLTSANQSGENPPVVEGEEEKGEEAPKIEEIVNQEKKEIEKKLPTPTEVFDQLQKEGLAFVYEDGSKPETYEEIVEVVKQSRLASIQEEINNAWEEKMNSLTPQVQTIIQYAQSGVTSATELNNLMNQVSYFERVSELDPKIEADQEQIVYLQLLNTGLTDTEAKEQVDILKESKLLERNATQAFPILKKNYEAQVRKTFQEQQEREEGIEQYVQNNAVNVQYFVENEKTFLPFSISKPHKIAVMNLAAKPIGIGENYEPIFGYNAHLKALQNGTEEQYKDFMDTMAFIADKKAYKEKIQTQASNKTAEKDFKKIAIPSKVNNSEAQQEYDGPTIQKKSNTAWSL
jgi:hypothetical protein